MVVSAGSSVVCARSGRVPRNGAVAPSRAQCEETTTEKLGRVISSGHGCTPGQGHSFSPAPEPENGVGIHHSSPRAVVMYSGQRRSTGGTKSRGSNGATHFAPPIPPPVRSLNSALTRSRIVGMRQQIEERCGQRFRSDEKAGVDRRRQPTQRIAAPCRIFVAVVGRTQPRTHGEQTRGRRMPAVFHVVVGADMELRGRQAAAHGCLELRGRGQALIVGDERIIHRRHSQIRLDRAAKFARLVVERRCADLFHVAIHQIDHRAVRQADAGLRHPAQRRLAATGRGGVTGIVGQHLADLLLHRERRRTPGILDLAEPRRQVVGRRIAAGKNELVQRPGAGVRIHRLLGVFGGRVHQAQRVDRAGTARRGVRRCPDRQQGLVDPLFGRQRLEGDHHAPIGAALGLALHRVGGMRMVTDESIAAVVVALGRMHRLRAADLLGRLAEEFQRAAQAVLLHRRLGRKDAGKCRRTKRRVRVGVAGGPRMQSLARRLERHHLLRLGRHGVVFGKAAQYRRPAAPGRGEGGRHAARAFLHREPLGAQQLAIGARRFVFPPGRFCEVPDRAVEFGQPGPVGVDPCDGRYLCRFQRHRFLPAQNSRRLSRNCGCA